MSGTTRIEPRDNGPLVVKNAASLRHHDGEAVDVKDVIALCRCGKSNSKPFCDGSHNDAGFTSENTEKAAGKDVVLPYEGGDVTVTYNPRLCSHAAECGRLAGEAFNPKQKPWIQPDKATRDQIHAVVAACPSGALALGEDRSHIVMEDRAAFEIEKNGPYWVTDVDPPEGPRAEGFSPRKYVLCRCGMSGSKPFCDGSHRDAGWKDDA